MGSATTDEVARTPITAALRNVGLFVGYLATLAQLARAYGIVDGLGEWLWYAGLGAVYLLLFTLIVLRPPARPWRSHGVLAIQCVIVLTLLWFDPRARFHDCAVRTARVRGRAAVHGPGPSGTGSPRSRRSPPAH